MNIKIQIHRIDPDGAARDCAILAKLELIARQGRKLVTLNEDINAKLDRVETLSGEIAGDLDEVIEKLNNAPAEGLTKAEAEALATRLDGHVTALEGIAGKVPEPPAEPA